MITISTDVIQQSAITDHFVHNAQFAKKNGNEPNGRKDKNIRFNHNDAVSLSDVEHHTETRAQPLIHATRTSVDIVDENAYGTMSSYTKYHDAQSSADAPPTIATTDTSNRVSFEKMALTPTHRPQKSGLSMMIGGDTDEKNEDTLAHALLTPTVITRIKIVFSEFNFNTKENSIVLEITDADVTVEEVLNDALSQFQTEYPQSKLQSHLMHNYELRCIDDDDIEDLYEMDADELDPPLTRNAKICEFVDKTASALSSVCTHMAMCYLESRKAKKSALAVALDGDRNRAKTMNTLHALAESQHIKQAVFIRVYIPGPTTETSVLLSIDCTTSASHTVRDLFTILNRKRSGREVFSVQYFDFYYKDKTKQYGAIANGVNIMDLIQNGLIILPKILSSDSGVNAKEAFQFLLVRLANEAKQYKAWKIDKYRTKKKAFLLEIDRYRFVKTALESSGFSVNISTKKAKNQTKIPIPIQDIQCVVATEKSNGHHHHHNQFTITYYTVERNKKVKTFEMSTTQIRDEIVDKLNFLCIIRRLQG